MAFPQLPSGLYSNVASSESLLCHSSKTTAFSPKHWTLLPCHILVVVGKVRSLRRWIRHSSGPEKPLLQTQFWFCNGGGDPQGSSHVTSSFQRQDFPGAPGFNNPPSNARGMGSIPGRGTKIPHALAQLSPHTTTEPACCN